jgi:hypothetical protein
MFAAVVDINSLLAKNNDYCRLKLEVSGVSRIRRRSFKVRNFILLISEVQTSLAYLTFIEEDF